MKKEMRDPGLQPERTSMSWLRTHMLMFGIGLLLSKIGEYHHNVLIEVNGVLLIIGAFISLFYSRQRFTQHLDYNDAVQKHELIAKIALSVSIALTATIYCIASLFQFFSR